MESTEFEYKHQAEQVCCGNHRPEVSHEVFLFFVIYITGTSSDDPNICDREDDYRRRRLNQVISPEISAIGNLDKTPKHEIGSEIYDDYVGIDTHLKVKLLERSSFFSNKFQSVAKTLMEREQNMKEIVLKLKTKAEEKKKSSSLSLREFEV
ncbi:hypothetical protein QVD17_30676 [Tagetes erecta]|uniref:Uncharacterized protein n=1 Tax=Tagetes erecta TaxID=13708 RepID=A0AAD8K339_TARER|nr:hypothetical protein QVD17_30676 [Tagetes erecta]